MTKYVDSSAIEPTTDPIALSHEPLSEVAETSPATSHGGSTNTQSSLWRPTEAQFTKAIAHYYGVSRKSVQQWFQTQQIAA